MTDSCYSRRASRRCRQGSVFAFFKAPFNVKLRFIALSTDQCAGHNSSPLITFSVAVVAVIASVGPLAVSLAPMPSLAPPFMASN